MRGAGFAKDGKPPAFCALQESNSAESFSRSLQGRIRGGPENAYPIQPSSIRILIVQ